MLTNVTQTQIYVNSYNLVTATASSRCSPAMDLGRWPRTTRSTGRRRTRVVIKLARCWTVISSSQALALSARFDVSEANLAVENFALCYPRLLMPTFSLNSLARSNFNLDDFCSGNVSFCTRFSSV